MQHSHRDLAMNLCLLLGTIVVFIGGMELALRFTGIIELKPSAPQIYQTSDNPEISYELRPNITEDAFRATVTTNSLGFRSPELDDRPLIAVIGDSITFGYGVENDETLAAQLEHFIPDVQFLNAGVPGYHLGQETATYQEKIAPLHPLGVILVFFFNDLTNTETAVLDSRNMPAPPDAVDAMKECSPIEEGILGLVPGRCWLDQHSALYVTIKKAVTLIDGNRQLSDAREEAQQEEAEDPITDDQLAQYRQQLDRLNWSIPSSQTAKIFVIWPDRHLHRDSRPQLKAMAEARGFIVIDLYDLFGNEVPTLLWDTVHPHPDALFQAADYIKSQIEALAAQ